jgi:cephalosporin hydroxylase
MVITNHFVSDLGLYKEDLMYLLHQSFCFRLGIIQGGSHVFIAPIILFQTWDYTRRISCIYCTNHCVSDLGLYKEDLMYLLHQSFCFRIGIIQGGSHVFIAPIIVFQTWDYTRRISCIYCTNHFVSDLGLYKEDLIYLLHQSSP